MKILSMIWEAPQTIAALLVKIIFKPTKLSGKSSDINIYTWKMTSGLSLGKTVFLPEKTFKEKTISEIDSSVWHKNYLLHECGHSIQSQYLGPLYLLIIGVPSLIWNACFRGWRAKTGTSYYWFFTEAWADKLGGIKREG